MIIFYLIYSLINVFLINNLIHKLFNKEFLAFRIYTIIECLFFSFYLYLIIQNNTSRKILIVSTLSFLLYSLFDLLRTSASSFDSIPSIIESLLLLSFSIYYLFEQIKNPNTLFLTNTANFWIIVGIIIFFSGNFFLFILAQNSQDQYNFTKNFRLILVICSILENILFLIAFIIARSEPKTVKSKLIGKNQGLQFWNPNPKSPLID